FDGTVGVLGGLEAIRALKRARHEPKRSIELLLFTSEEPTRFGIGCLGSRLLCGSLDPSFGSSLKDAQGQSLDEVRAATGFHGRLATVPLPPNYYAGFVELHIEQGPLLERDGIPIGVVTSIAAPASLRVFVEGEGGHAGAVLMPQRRDAFCAAAEVVLAVESAAKSTGSLDTVATAGVCDIYPGAVNSVPSRVRLDLDVRDVVAERRDNALRAIYDACDEIALRRGVHIRTEPINSDDPAQCDPSIVQAISDTATRHGFQCQPMISRAYHDSLFMTRIVPAAMIFIPCKDGLSHRPDEYASPQDIGQGVLVLAETLRTLSLQ
ncbi:MAG: M20 family metallo-hydrolase, partial [Acidobacteriaceae bacterium]|nr:M20 family metallo-hydrolase [Acidobacteriaceae bacterium]